MLYVQLDTNWPDHPKIMQAGMEGAGLHAIALCLAKRLESDGWIHRWLLHRQGASDELIDRLVVLELFDAHADQVRPHGWLDRNPSQAAIDAKKAAKAESGRRGNHVKWNHDGEYESCPKCQAIAGCDRTGSHSDRSNTKSESESEVAIAIATPIARRVPGSGVLADFVPDTSFKPTEEERSEARAIVEDFRGSRGLFARKSAGEASA
jgi:hypothetical protein